MNSAQKSLKDIDLKNNRVPEIVNLNKDKKLDDQEAKQIIEFISTNTQSITSILGINENELNFLKSPEQDSRTKLKQFTKLLFGKQKDVSEELWNKILVGLMQKQIGAIVDGVAGPKTFDKLLNYLGDTETIKAIQSHFELKKTGTITEITKTTIQLNLNNSNFLKFLLSLDKFGKFNFKQNPEKIKKEKKAKQTLSLFKQSFVSFMQDPFNDSKVNATVSLLDRIKLDELKENQKKEIFKLIDKQSTSYVLYHFIINRTNTDNELADKATIKTRLEHLSTFLAAFKEYNGQNSLKEFTQSLFKESEKEEATKLVSALISLYFKQTGFVSGVNGLEGYDKKNEEINEKFDKNPILIDFKKYDLATKQAILDLTNSKDFDINNEFYQRVLVKMNENLSSLSDPTFKVLYVKGVENLLINHKDLMNTNENTNKMLDILLFRTKAAQDYTTQNYSLKDQIIKAKEIIIEQTNNIINKYFDGLDKLIGQLTKHINNSNLFTIKDPNERFEKLILTINNFVSSSIKGFDVNWLKNYLLKRFSPREIHSYKQDTLTPAVKGEILSNLKDYLTKQASISLSKLGYLSIPVSDFDIQIITSALMRVELTEFKGTGQMVKGSAYAEAGMFASTNSKMYGGEANLDQTFEHGGLSGKGAMSFTKQDTSTYSSANLNLKELLGKKDKYSVNSNVSFNLSVEKQNITVNRVVDSKLISELNSFGKNVIIFSEYSGRKTADTKSEVSLSSVFYKNDKGEWYSISGLYADKDQINRILGLRERKTLPFVKQDISLQSDVGTFDSDQSRMGMILALSDTDTNIRSVFANSNVKFPNIDFENLNQDNRTGVASAVSYTLSDNKDKNITAYFWNMDYNKNQLVSLKYVQKQENKIIYGQIYTPLTNKNGLAFAAKVRKNGIEGSVYVKQKGDLGFGSVKINPQAWAIITKIGSKDNSVYNAIANYKNSQATIIANKEFISPNYVYNADNFKLGAGVRPDEAYLNLNFVLNKFGFTTGSIGVSGEIKDKQLNGLKQAVVGVGSPNSKFEVYYNNKFVGANASYILGTRSDKGASIGLNKHISKNRANFSLLLTDSIFSGGFVASKEQMLYTANIGFNQRSGGVISYAKGEDKVLGVGLVYKIPFFEANAMAYHNIDKNNFGLRFSFKKTW